MPRPRDPRTAIPAGGLRAPRRERRLREPGSGFILTLAIILGITILVIGTFVGVAALRNGLLLRSQRLLVRDGATPARLIGRPLDFGACEEPGVQCVDPANGLKVLAYLRPDRFATRNQVFYAGTNCSGQAFLAPPAVPPSFPPELPVGYLNDGLDVDGLGARVGYGVGAPRNWPCLPLDPGAGAACADGGLLYRTAGAPADTVIQSVWTSLAPDCAFNPLPAGSIPDEVCEDVGATPLRLSPTVEVLADPGNPGAGNLLEAFTPPFAILPPTLSFTPAAPEGGPLVVGPDLGPPAPTAFTPPAAEGEPPVTGPALGDPPAQEFPEAEPEQGDG